MKLRRKVEAIDGVQWPGKLTPELAAWLNMRKLHYVVSTAPRFVDGQRPLTITFYPTEASQTVQPGEWLVDNRGKVTLMSPEWFHTIYEPFDNPPAPVIPPTPKLTKSKLSAVPTPAPTEEPTP